VLNVGALILAVGMERTQTRQPAVGGFDGLGDEAVDGIDLLRGGRDRLHQRMVDADLCVDLLKVRKKLSHRK
jgi:hypothetical protein